MIWLGTKERKKEKKRPFFHESLVLYTISFTIIFLNGSYYIALSQTISALTKSIQHGLHITCRFQHLPLVCELVGYVLKEVFRIHNSSSILKIHKITNNTHT